MVFVSAFHTMLIITPLKIAILNLMLVLVVQLIYLSYLLIVNILIHPRITTVVVITKSTTTLLKVDILVYQFIHHLPQVGPYNVYNEIVGNEFTGQYYYSIRLYYSTGYTLIKDNLIHNPTYTSHYGIYTYYTTGNVIDGNEIHPGRYGIYTYRENYYHSTNQTYITNNMISGFTYTTYQMGIYLGIL